MAKLRTRQQTELGGGQQDPDSLPQFPGQQMPTGDSPVGATTQPLPNEDVQSRQGPRQRMPQEPTTPPGGPSPEALFGGGGSGFGGGPVQAAPTRPMTPSPMAGSPAFQSPTPADLVRGVPVLGKAGGLMGGGLGVAGQVDPDAEPTALIRMLLQLME